MNQVNHVALTRPLAPSRELVNPRCGFVWTPHEDFAKLATP